MGRSWEVLLYHRSAKVYRKLSSLSYKGSNNDLDEKKSPKALRSSERCVVLQHGGAEIVCSETATYHYSRDQRELQLWLTK